MRCLPRIVEVASEKKSCVIFFEWIGDNYVKDTDLRKTYDP
jgi:hypothetical protein